MGIFGSGSDIGKVKAVADSAERGVKSDINTTTSAEAPPLWQLG